MIVYQGTILKGKGGSHLFIAENQRDEEPFFKKASLKYKQLSSPLTPLLLIFNSLYCVSKSKHNITGKQLLNGRSLLKDR